MFSKMKILNATLICFLFMVQHLVAQDTLIRRNSIYFELGGNALLYSINYDRTFRLNDNLKLAPRVGFMYLPPDRSSDFKIFPQMTNIPLELNLLLGKSTGSSTFAEVGFGLNYISYSDGYTSRENDARPEEHIVKGVVTTARLGFRHQKPAGGIMYRLGMLVPLSRDRRSMVYTGDDIFPTLWGGFSLGYAF